MKHPIPVTLSESDRASLHTFIHAGKANARTFTRARILRHPPTKARSVTSSPLVHLRERGKRARTNRVPYASS
jgi:hypothetical protein